jgi:hypothetical protein
VSGALRLAVGIALGLGLASLPFLHYAPRAHPHAPAAPHVHTHHE